jgi:hypothetical protein
MVVLISASPTSAVVPFASLDWVEFQWLGAGPNGIAIRELRTPDLGEGEQELCDYPGDANGVSLVTWPLPEVAAVVTPHAKKIFPIYVSGVASKGCTSESAAKASLALAKAYWRDQKIEFEKRVLTQRVWSEVWSEQHDVPFVGSCFKTGSRSAGCSLQKKAFDLELRLKLLASSDCVTTTDTEFEYGCTAERVYSGTVKAANHAYPFSIRVVKPSIQTSVQTELRHIDLVTIEPYQFMVFTFTTLFLSQREQTQVLLRLW